MNARSQRGSALLLAVIVVLVVAVISAGVLRYTSRELAGATAGRRADALVACAEAGRQALLSQFRAVGVNLTDLAPLNIPLDAQTGGSTSVVGGHIDGTVDQISLLALPDTVNRTTSDITNILLPSRAQRGGTGYRIMVHCVDHGRQLEVEFGVKFGL